MEEYKDRFFNNFDPIIIEEYKNKIFTLNKNYLPKKEPKYKTEYAPWCYENKYFNIGQKIILRINKKEYKEFIYLNAILNEETDKFEIIESNIHILYPLFGMYLHILLEFTDGNLDLVKNRIKITREYQKKYTNNIIYLKTVINSIENNVDLNSMIFNLKPTSGDVILWAYIYYRIRKELTRNSFMETLTLMTKYYFNIDGIMYKNIYGKKMIINRETGERKKIMNNLYYCLAIRAILLLFINSYEDFVINIENQIWKNILVSELFESDIYYAFVNQFGNDIMEIKNNENLKRIAFEFTLK